MPDRRLFELLPGDDMETQQNLFDAQLRARLKDRGRNPEHIMLTFIETYAGHRLSPDHRLGKCAAAAATLVTKARKPFDWCGFNSGCEAGLRANVLNTPTLVWGPGSLMQAMPLMNM